MLVLVSDADNRENCLALMNELEERYGFDAMKSDIAYSFEGDCGSEDGNKVNNKVNKNEVNCIPYSQFMRNKKAKKYKNITLINHKNNKGHIVKEFRGTPKINHKEYSCYLMTKEEMKKNFLATDGKRKVDKRFIVSITSKKNVDANEVYNKYIISEEVYGNTSFNAINGLVDGLVDNLAECYARHIRIEKGRM